MNIIDQLKWRYATKTFDPNKKIDDPTWEKIEQSLVLTPSSFGLQPWKFVVVTNDEIKQAMLPHSWNQTQVTDCSHFVILCAREAVSKEDIDAFLDDTVTTRGGTRDDLKEYEGMMTGFIKRMTDEEKLNWAKNQVYIALGQLMATAAVLEVDACPMEGINPPEFDSILGLEGYKTVVACALGYRSEEDKYATLPKVRFTSDVVVDQRH